MGTLRKSIEKKMFGLVEKCQSSNVTTRAFCEEHELAEHIYYYWQRKYQSQYRTSKFIPLEIGHLPEDNSRDITITYPSGVCVKLSINTSISVLKELIHIN